MLQNVFLKLPMVTISFEILLIVRTEMEPTHEMWTDIIVVI